ncbi:MAG: hypothetical protein WBB07_25340 [Mycobacterium sp.]
MGSHRRSSHRRPLGIALYDIFIERRLPWSAPTEMGRNINDPNSGAVIHESPVRNSCFTNPGAPHYETKGGS